MWLFKNNKKKHPDEVEAYRHEDGTLYADLHALNCRRERDAKGKAKTALKNLLYYLSVDKVTYDQLNNVERAAVQCRVERYYVFRGKDRDFDKLASILITHWPYLSKNMNDYYNERRNYLTTLHDHI